MLNYWSSRCALRWMSVVWNHVEIQKHGVTQYFRFTVDLFFVLGILISLICVWMKKTNVLFIYIHKRVKSFVFAVCIKFCAESGLAILISSHHLWLWLPLCINTCNVLQDGTYRFIFSVRQQQDLGQFLAGCDYVCSVLPSTPETSGLLSGNVLKACQEKVIVLLL